MDKAQVLAAIDDLASIDPKWPVNAVDRLAGVISRLQPGSPLYEADLDVLLGVAACVRRLQGALVATPG